MGGKYTLDELLGFGGMAAVYRARHRNGHRVAIKVLHPEFAGSPEIRRQFFGEGYAVNKVKHRAVVRITDDGVTPDDLPYLVMELLDGETLKSRMEVCGGTLSPREIVLYMCQVLEVLSVAHAHGVVHRDIKPDNLFVEQESGALKVLDFGLARQSEDLMVQTAILLGTPAYMAPEQALGQTWRVDGRTDIWAVGALLFRALTGRYVFHGDNAQMVIIKAASEPPPRLAPLAPAVAPELCAIVDRALEASMEERWPTADAMLAALRALDMERLSNVRGPASSGPELAAVSSNTSVVLVLRRRVFSRPGAASDGPADAAAARPAARPAPSVTHPAASRLPRTGSR